MAVDVVRDAKQSKAAARTQVQRERILSAALSCFVDSGFHAASMAKIAETANMSPGLIYRYFASKDDIILAIIDQQLEVSRARIRDLHSSNDLVEGFMRNFEESDCPGGTAMSCALYLEMSAEATRNPAIAAALQRFDRMIRSELADWLEQPVDQGGHGLSRDCARRQSLMLICLVAGLKVISAREPGIDRDLLRNALESFAGTLGSGERVP